MPEPSFDLRSTYLFVAGKGDAARIDQGPAFWADLMRAQPAHDVTRRVQQEDGWLLVDLQLDGDFPQWEMHPEGDEVFIMTEGALELDLDDGGRTWTQPLRAGETFVVPKGAWHFARATPRARLFVMTFGRGTQHRPR